jgi:hypothetical protein
MARKTYRRKSKSKKRHCTKRRVIRSKRGGANGNNNINMNDEFEVRVENIVQRLRNIFNDAIIASERLNARRTDGINFINRILNLENEADAIDAHYNNNILGNLLIEYVRIITNMFVNINNNMNNNNNNNTASTVSIRRKKVNGNNSNNEWNTNNEL